MRWVVSKYKTNNYNYYVRHTLEYAEKLAESLATQSHIEFVKVTEIVPTSQELNPRNQKRNVGL